MMKRRARFFSGKVLGRDLTRFAPVWGVYTVLLAVFLLQLRSNTSDGTSLKLVLTFQQTQFLIPPLMAVYGTVCALTLFSDLFKPRMCHTLHTMPLRREGWFLTHVAAGLLFYLIPSGLFCGVLCDLLGKWWNLGLILLLIAGIQFLFFFSVGIFSVQCAGNALGAVIICGMVNFFSIFLYWGLHILYAPYLFGVPLDGSKLSFYAPVVRMLDMQFFERQYYGDNEDGNACVVRLASEGWRYLRLLAGVGLLVLCLSLVLLRRRKLEKAGDLLALNWLKPVFLVLFSCGAGVLLYMLVTTTVGLEKLWILGVGIAVSFFGGRMLLERRVNIFRPKAFLALAGILGVLGVSILAMRADVFGIVRWMPKAEKVEAVQITVTGYGDYPAVVEAPEDIEKLLQFHAERLETRDIAQRWESQMEINLTYRLKNGLQVRRSYMVQDPVNGALLRPYLSQWQRVFRVEDPGMTWQAVRDKISWAALNEYSDIYLTKSETRMLLEAMYADCEAGTMAQEGWYFQNSRYTYLIRLSSNIEGYIRVDERCENTIHALSIIIQRYQRLHK